MTAASPRAGGSDLRRAKRSGGREGEERGEISVGVSSRRLEKCARGSHRPRLLPPGVQSTRCFAGVRSDVDCLEPMRYASIYFYRFPFMYF